MTDLYSAYYQQAIMKPGRGDVGMGRNVPYRISSERHTRTTADDGTAKAHVLRGAGMTSSREAQSTEFFASLAKQPEWMGEGLCAQTDPELFFPERGGHWQEAKAVCNGCPVRDLCLEFALTHGERGIWGGTSDRDRMRMRRQIWEAS